jgi:hypothetical protein
MPCSVHLCPNGCVCLALGGTSVHLPRQQFQELLKGMLEAAEHLGLAAWPSAGLKLAQRPQ